MNATMEPSLAMNEDQDNALQAKIITMVTLFCLSMVVGLAPMLISIKFGWFKNPDDTIRSNKSVVGLLSFGGGVLFATTFMHLLPEVNENIEVLQDGKSPIYSRFKDTHSIKHRRTIEGNTDAGKLIQSSSERINKNKVTHIVRTGKMFMTNCWIFTERRRLPMMEWKSHSKNYTIEHLEASKSTPVFEAFEIESGVLPDVPISFASLIMCFGFFMMYLIEELVHVYINSRNNKTANTSFTRILSIRRKSTESDGNNEQPIKEVESQKHDHSYVHVKMDDTKVTAFRGLLIVLALSIHELFEGLAVGLESSVRNVWYMFGAVSAHKYIIAFCVGVELLAAGTKRWLSVVYIFTFSFTSALGIGIGILLVGGAGATEAGITSVILQGLACGTLVYVVFFEIWRQDRTGLLQFFCAVIGFTLMVILQTVADKLL